MGIEHFDVHEERPRCAVFMAVSVDGFIARSDGGLDWLEAVQLEGEDYGYQAFFDSVDALVMGRNTYDAALSFERWPYEGKRCIVLTHRPASSRHGETFFDGTPDELIRALGRDGVRGVYVDGGATIRQFLASRLIDEMTLSIIPVVLGSGIRLFDSGAPEHPLVLLGSRSWPTGLVQVRYRARH